MADIGDLQPTKLVIGGERFQIQTDLSPEELQALVNYIEEKMAVHLTPSLRAEPRKQLILMAMEIASELFALRQRVAELEQSQERTAESMEHLVDLLSAEEREVKNSSETNIDPLGAAEAFLSPR